MWLKSFIFASAAGLCVQPVSAQEAQPDAQVLAQALDRCMATYAVRLTRTPAPDEQIYAEATKGCDPLRMRFEAAVNAQVAPDQAARLLKATHQAQKPNFLNMLQKIRRDRAQRESGSQGQ